MLVCPYNLKCTKMPKFMLECVEVGETVKYEYTGPIRNA